MPLQFSSSRRINTLLALSVGVGSSFYFALQMLLWFGPSLARLLRSVMRISELQPGEISAALRRGLLHGARHVVDQFTGRADLCHLIISLWDMRDTRLVMRHPSAWHAEGPLIWSWCFRNVRGGSCQLARLVFGVLEAPWPRLFRGRIVWEEEGFWARHRRLA